ncbi:MAG: DUF2961 domain-containing protein [Candidatus Hydrogenedentes bacterium]|nr:DUF2961 domain-containing protein [Candidatus Hydrogenedentota bacterium]
MFTTISFRLSILLAVTGLLAVCYTAYSEEVVSMETLLNQMTDLGRLAEADNPRYVTRQFSSYDRKSTDPGIPTEENWFANADRGQHLRQEQNDGQTEYVLMDADGPGAMVRFWSANPDEGGVVKIYLDRQETPAIEMPLTDLLGGKSAPFIAPLCGERSRGWNSYFPIPYARHCKVTITKGNIYYIIDYRTYAEDVSVRTFTLQDAEAHSATIHAVAKTLDTPADAIDENRGSRTPYDITLAPDAFESITLPGPAAIYQITCKVSAEDPEAALRGCMAEIAFDGRSPGVLAPLGDFFGTAPGVNPYQSLPSGALEDGTLYSHWVMPFKQEAVIRLRNHSGVELHLQGVIGVENRPWTESSMYFHAKWKCERDIPTRPFQDWNYFAAEGAGRFCGVMLHMANPVPDWWGEGDEKIYVDGEPFPSFFGTGTEDYFGYAWCSPALFTHAYHNQPRCDGPGNMGHTCVSRFHIMDDIPFTTSFKFDLELWHWADTTVTQAIMAYWYALPGATDNFPPVNPKTLIVPELPEPPGVEGALEGEKMRIVSKSGGTAEPQGGWPWSRALHLWWRHGNPGDTLVLGFNVEKAGNYEVLAVFTKAPDYGIHQVAVNGTPTGAPIDLYHDSVIIAKEQSLGRFDLQAGENLLAVRITGRRPEAQPGHMFGLDYLRLAE